MAETDLGPARRTTRRVRVIASAGIVGAVLLAVLLVPPLVQLDQQAVDLAAKLRPPSWEHPFGTDDVGRDLLLRCVYGLRVSLLVGIVAGLTATVIGTAVGALAAAFGGWTDRVVMRLVDTFSSVPHLLLGIFIVAMFRPGVGPVIVSVALTHWLSTARIVRAEVLSLRSRPFIDAAVSGGASRGRVVVRHLLPAVLPQAASPRCSWCRTPCGTSPRSPSSGSDCPPIRRAWATSYRRPGARCSRGTGGRPSSPACS